MNVAHETAAHRFVVSLPEGQAMLIYEMKSKGIMEVLSTYVPVAARGRKVGGALVLAALTHARAHSLRVIPTCWYVGTWVDQHPEYRELLVD
jgi:predicted GNAT family acetyltransferase